jgi:hypothetical protein
MGRIFLGVFWRDVILNGGGAGVRDLTSAGSLDEVEENSCAARRNDVLFDCIGLHSFVGSLGRLSPSSG